MTAVATSGRRGFTLIELTITIVVILILATIALSIGNRVLRKSEADETRSALEIGATALHEWTETAGRQPTYGTTSSNWSYLLTGMNDSSAYQYDFTIPEPLAGGTDVGTLLGSRERELHEAVEELGHQVWGRLKGNDAARNIMAKIDDDLLRAEEEGDSSVLCLHDSWGVPVMVVFPGRKWRTDGAAEGYNDAEDSSQGLWRDEDGTIRTFEERMVGPARNGRVYLVSAGPDGRFGNLDYSAVAGGDFPPADEPDFVERPEYQHTLDNIYSYEVRTW
ncbi:MAG: prepilin-type N-terminal cleavage/methylation domain-containing protein [Phycisphaerales bacterium]|nr:prepilin-type N-terminal cleavage/methylation domain-containing protein [Phycisphaerales bacterium]